MLPTPTNMEVGDEDIWAGHIDSVGRLGGAEKPRGLDLAGLRHRAPPSPILCLSNTTQRPPPSVVLDSNLSHRCRSCVVLDLLPASGASPCLLVPKSSFPAGAGGGPRSTERGPPPRRTAHSSVQPRFRAECVESVENGERRSGDEVQHTGEEQKRGIQIPVLFAGKIDAPSGAQNGQAGSQLICREEPVGNGKGDSQSRRWKK